MTKPKFYQAVLVEVENVIKHVYPNQPSLTITDRMGTENAICEMCGYNRWWLLPKECVSVNESGKPYIECLSCGHTTHL